LRYEEDDIAASLNKMMFAPLCFGWDHRLARREGVRSFNIAQIYRWVLMATRTAKLASFKIQK
jgi:hypothetical protein